MDKQPHIPRTGVLLGPLFTLAWLATLAPGCVSSADPPDDTCSDLRQFGDHKLRDDRCWDPPTHYCADGASTVVVQACRPDYSVCCTFAMTCFPCGWRECIANPDPRCDTAPLDTEECALPAIRPDVDATFCFD